ncbi:N-6 DNA methylase [Methylobacterium sp. Leaf91]|uniref:class I SAM-dependent DNA methyltransferase n=1 Tax=Methylobacterium sp. Leaf91 TaxID=1736247 RepID=UPI0006F4C4F0|nr:N-6 DNA methylase [Methylobacterium sp. Leaf91]KQP00342.1 hypothetical protein ASF32_00105 [Methylobacterium sp. Leaf91]
MTTSHDLVTKLWRLCTLLRKDGVTYPQYVTELTYLIFLKLAQRRISAGKASPLGTEWQKIVDAPDKDVLHIYKKTLSSLGTNAREPLVRTIFEGAQTVVRDPLTLRRLVAAIDGATWSSDDGDLFGDAYEGLLQKNAEETKRGAGQYFTPRLLVDAIVRLMKPSPGETIQDPAAGTGGFLIAVKRDMEESETPGTRKTSYRGVENVADTYRLLCMNLYLHGINPTGMFMGDTLSPLGQQEILGNADLILSNPPFGASGGPPTRDDLTITARSTTFQLPFVEHCMRALAPGGRAAVIVPDNILFDGGRGRTLRQELMKAYELHTILRLPTGIFYAQGVRTNVLFFNRPLSRPEGDATCNVWIYDLRANGAPGKRGTAGLAPGLALFVKAYGMDPRGHAKRLDEGPEGRFRCFSREEIRMRDDDLYVTWLKESDDIDEGLEFAAPDAVASVVEQHLVFALDEIKALMADLVEDTIDNDGP